MKTKTNIVPTVVIMAYRTGRYFSWICIYFILNESKSMYVPAILHCNACIPFKIMASCIIQLIDI